METMVSVLRWFIVFTFAAAHLVNLFVRALKPDYLLLDIFLDLRLETWTQWTIEAARVKVHHRPYSFGDGPVVYPANAFDSHLRDD